MNLKESDAAPIMGVRLKATFTNCDLYCSIFKIIWPHRTDDCFSLV